MPQFSREYPEGFSPPQYGYDMNTPETFLPEAARWFDGLKEEFLANCEKALRSGAVDPETDCSAQLARYVLLITAESQLRPLDRTEKRMLNNLRHFV